MSEYREIGGSDAEEMDEIYLPDLLYDIGKAIKKFWWVAAGMTLAVGLLASLFVNFTYSPQYTATATMSVKERGNTGYNATESAKKMKMVFPYILTSGVLKNVVAEEMGLEEMPGKVRVAVEEDVNIFTVYATADDPQVAYELLWAVIDNYPRVAEYVVGRTKLEVLAESGVPKNSGKNNAVKNALKYGGVLGAFFGLLPMGIYILTRHTVKSKKELKKSFNLRELGTLPFVREKKRKKVPFFSSLSLLNERIPQYYLEAVNKMSSRLMKEMEQKGCKSVLITSSAAREGKSTLAVNFAIAAAKNGKKVVLVDCDMRNPSIAAIMNETGKFSGLTSVLQGKVNVEKALKKVNLPDADLKVLYGEKADDDKENTLLGTEAMKSLIDTLCEKTDFVILDAAPSELLVDSSIIARFTDAAMYVVRYDYVKMHQIQNGVQALSMSGTNILGYVFNADESGQSSGYGYGYKYYGRYGRYLTSKRYGYYGQTSSKRRDKKHS